MLEATDVSKGPFIYGDWDEDLDGPHHEPEPIASVAGALEWEESLRSEYFGGKSSKDKSDTGTRLQEMWFRGTRKHYPLVPGIYRAEISALAKDDRWMFGDKLPRKAKFAGKQPSAWRRLAEQEHKRLNMERDMILAFERESRPLLEYGSEQELYFLARHYGMPSRLLDWTISPLVALFMCVFPEGAQAEESDSQDAVIYAMDPEKLKPHKYICHQNDPKVANAIEVVTKWEDPYQSGFRNLGILAVRPHTLAGRIDRQQSRFTLHSHFAKPQQNKRLRSRLVPKLGHNAIRGQLERIGINEFSVYNTLDRLVSDIRSRFSKPSNAIKSRTIGEVS